jgi:hypothetical protein
VEITQAASSAALRDQHRDAIQAAISAEQSQRGRLVTRGGPESSRPFVTISREAGLDAHAIANTLAALLNARCPTGARWTVWDRHSLEAAMKDEGLCETMEQALSGASSAWYLQFSSGLGIGTAGRGPDEFLRERRLALMVRLLARAGRAIIIGCAGVYATQDLTGGVHVRLVAPLARRKGTIAAAMRMSQADAAVELRRVDREREATHRRFCSGKALSPDYFTVTFNGAVVPAMQSALSLLLLIPQADGGSALPATPRAATAEAKSVPRERGGTSRPSDGTPATPSARESLRLAAESYLLEESLIQASDTRPGREDHLQRLAAARRRLRDALHAADGGVVRQDRNVEDVETMGAGHGN